MDRNNDNSGFEQDTSQQGSRTPADAQGDQNAQHGSKKPDDSASVRKVVPRGEDKPSVESVPHTGGNATTRGIVGLKDFIMRAPGAAGSALFRGVRGAARGVAHASGSFAGKVGAFLNIPTKAAGVGMAAALGLVSIAGGVTYTNYVYEHQALLDETTIDDDCSTDVKERLKESMMNRISWARERVRP